MLWLRDIFERAKKGDEHSTELLVERYYKLAYSVAYDWIRKGVISKDDGLSEAHVALMKCIRGGYDPERGEFSTYLVRAVDNQIKMYLRRVRRDSQIQYVDNHIVLEDGEVDLIDSILDEGRCVEGSVEDKLIIEEIKKILKDRDKLSEKEANCLMMRVQGMTCDEISDRLDLSQSYVSRLSLSAARKIRREIDKDGGE